MKKKELQQYPLTPLQAFRPNMSQLMSEANKYLALGNIVDAVKEYKENESPLDIQLRKFRELKNKL